MSEAISTEWGRRRLLALLAGVAVVGLLLVLGFALAIASALRPGGAPASQTALAERFPAGPEGVRGRSFRDALAAQPMLQADESDLEPAMATTQQVSVFNASTPPRIGPAGVPTGFRHTPAGAVQQLAEIEQSVLEPMSIARARDVFDVWAMPGAVFEHWELAASIQSFQAASGSVEGGEDVSVTANPAGAQVKGTDGRDWVVACVQMDVRVSVRTERRFGFGHCSRMQWSNRRWQIAAGHPPAQAPSTWPGSQRSVDAGWRRWVDRGDQ